MKFIIKEIYTSFPEHFTQKFVLPCYFFYLCRNRLDSKFYLSYRLFVWSRQSHTPDVREIIPNFAMLQHVYWNDSQHLKLLVYCFYCEKRKKNIYMYRENYLKKYCTGIHVFLKLIMLQSVFASLIIWLEYYLDNFFDQFWLFYTHQNSW